MTSGSSATALPLVSHIKESLVSRDPISRIDSVRDSYPAEQPSWADGGARPIADGIHSSSDFELCLRLLDNAIEQTRGHGGHPLQADSAQERQTEWLTVPDPVESPWLSGIDELERAQLEPTIPWFTRKTPRD